MTITNEQRIESGFDLGESLMRAKGVCPPVFIFEGPDGIPVIMPAGWHDPEEREQTICVVRLLGVASDAVCISMVSEAWSLALSKSDNPDILPSQSERRVEVVSVALAVRGKDSIDMTMDQRPIERDAKGAFVGLSESTLSRGQGTSWLQSAVPPFPVPDALRGQARELLKMIGFDWELISKQTEH
jgi:hypothetical protein